MIHAAYTTTCPACQKTIEPGDPIEHENELELWVHQSCIGSLQNSSVPLPVVGEGGAKKPGTVCGDCFQVIPPSRKCGCVV